MTRLLVWADLGQASLIRETVEMSGLELAGVGAFDGDDARELAMRLDVSRHDDLRQAVVHGDADIIWIAAAGAIEADERRAIRERGISCVSTEPRPVDLGDFIRDADEGRTAGTIPLLRQGAAFRAAREARAEFGTAVSARIECLGAPPHGSLVARLFDAVDVLCELIGDVETIDAALGHPEREPMDGHLTALVRGATASATILASNQAGAWRRSMTLLGTRGTLRIDDAGYTWHDGDGNLAEQFDVAEAPTSAPALFAEQLRRRVEQLDDVTGPPPDLAERLSLCAAARLSVRTRQPEAPESLRRMLERV